MDLTRYRRRFGGEGTIITLADGRAFTAAHCVALVDGRAGTTIVAPGGRAWRVVRRWSPRGCDLARLAVAVAQSARPRRRARGPLAGVALATRALVRIGVTVAFHGWNGRRFVAGRAVVVAVSATRAVAEVRGRRGVVAGDSGAPVVVGHTLVGVVTHRTGVSRSSHASSQLVFTRLDAPAMRGRMRAAGARPPRSRPRV